MPPQLSEVPMISDNFRNFFNHFLLDDGSDKLNDASVKLSKSKTGKHNYTEFEGSDEEEEISIDEIKINLDGDIEPDQKNSKIRRPKFNYLFRELHQSRF